MNILVCLKQILDPEMPARDFRVDALHRVARQEGAAMVTSIFCANALETALQFRERFQAKITAISFGSVSAEETLRKAMALRVDSAILIEHAFLGRIDPFFTGKVLAAAAMKLGGFDLIFTGREAGDWGDGQTGGVIAEELSCSCVSFVDQVELDTSRPGTVRLRRQTDQGWDAVEVGVPAVLTITNNEHNVPRIAKTRDVMQAFRQPLTRWTLQDVGFDPANLDVAEFGTEVVELAVAEKQSRCQWINGETIEERIEQLAEKIVSAMQG